jgi:hypothetical protein
LRTSKRSGGSRSLGVSKPLSRGKAFSTGPHTRQHYKDGTRHHYKADSGPMWISFGHGFAVILEALLVSWWDDIGIMWTFEVIVWPRRQYLWSPGDPSWSPNITLDYLMQLFFVSFRQHPTPHPSPRPTSTNSTTAQDGWDGVGGAVGVGWAGVVWGRGALLIWAPTGTHGIHGYRRIPWVPMETMGTHL